MKPGFEVWLCLPCRTADPNSLAVADISKRGDCECCNKPAVLHKYRVTNTDVGVSLKGAMRAAENNINVNGWSKNRNA